MGIRNTIRWVRTEWALFAKAESMSHAERLRWLRQWGPFGARTAGYGMISLVLGPLTPGHDASTWAARRWSEESVRALGIRLETSGLEQVPAGACVLISNHQSLLDILVLGAVLPGDFRWAAKRSLMNVPFIGWHLRLAGHVPVDRGGGSGAAAQVVDRFACTLRQGKPLLLFPEGTRSEDGQIRAFKDGGFRAAVRARVPVVPVAIEGTFALMGKHAADTGSVAERERRLVRVRVGASLVPPAEGGEDERMAVLRERAREAVVAMHAELRRAASAQ
jgi:1-acyl-sn-glycerol-3-phosphate acyltransferase